MRVDERARCAVAEDVEVGSGHCARKLWRQRDWRTHVYSSIGRERASLLEASAGFGRC